MASARVADGYILGLDVGANSIGWALIGYDDGSPQSIIDAGARTFDAGVEGQLESGRDQSRSVDRREARAVRRRLDRRARRLNHLFHILQKAGLLPSDETDWRNAGRAAKSACRDRVIKNLDARLRAEWESRLQEEDASAEQKRLLAHRMPYVLRARALDDELTPHELGRAIYHLAQRRGFLSNRKARKEDKEEGVVKEGISHLRGEIADAEARTLGEYFSTIDPELLRIRGRYTHRQMYEDEFELIWSRQAEFHPDLLTDDLKEAVHRAIFYQRPLKSAAHLIGFCEYEEGRRRAPWGILPAQRFRLLQKLNDLLLTDADGVVRDLSRDERLRLIEALETKGDMTFNQVRRLLKLPKGYLFNLEAGGEKKIPGNRTAKKIIDVIGKRWQAMSDADRDRLVGDLLTIANENTMRRRAVGFWNLGEEAAAKLAAVELQDKYCSYCSLSRQALERLLPLVERGVQYMTAVREVYGPPPVTEPLDVLPRVADAVPQLRNPAVARALTELRRLINAITRTYGKPLRIRVELARDLKRGRDRRKRTWKQNRDNQRARLVAADRITREAGIQNPSRRDIEKFLLAEECGWICPYTGKPIGITGLFGQTPQFDVEHIIPFSRSLDNSFINKTLCDASENRSVKRGKTPFEAYGSQPERWEQILLRVKRLRSHVARFKLERFRAEALPDADDFADRQLNDTAYASREAVSYLGCLYGGVIDAAGKRRVQAGAGRATAHLRLAWGLNGILGKGDGKQKSREDHRHHAVDAIVVALGNPGSIAQISRAAQRAERLGDRLVVEMPMPWEDFREDAQRALDRINISTRVNRKLNGRLHEDTLYSPVHTGPDGKPYRHVRKRLDEMSKDEFAAIVDDAVRARVRERLEGLGHDPEHLAADALRKTFSDPGNLPFLETREGVCIPIRSARVRKAVGGFTVGSGVSERHVTTAANHHVEILEVLDDNGDVKTWRGEVVSRFEALRRFRANEPVVRREHGPGLRFLWSLSLRETVRMRHDSDALELYTCYGVSIYRTGQVNIDFRRNRDARPGTTPRKIKGTRVRVSKTPAKLRKAGAEKVVIDPLGQVRRARD